MLSVLSENPDVPQTELAKVLGITQPAICLRLKKLQEEGVLKKCIGLAPDKMTGKFCLVMGKEPLKKMKKLPGFVFGFSSNEKTYAVLYGVNLKDKPEGFEKAELIEIDGHFSIPVRVEKEC